jgi:RNA polymerase sigma-70 factor (ECF subfamily)
MQDEPLDDPGARLMMAWMGGEESAFDGLVEAYSGQVYALMTRFLGRHSGREDLVQEVFLRVIRARDRYEPRARFTTWLYRIVYNLCVNETQRAGGRDHVSIERSSTGADPEDAGPPEIFDERAMGPSESMERDDIVRQVREAIADLPEGQRMALVLAKYHDMAYSEIADVLGSSEKAIKSLIHRARETLRATLAPLLAEELS